MLSADRNRIDRVPTRGERWLGIALSALLAFVFLPCSIFLLVRSLEREEVRATGFALAAVAALIGLTGIFLLYRFCFTEGHAASARAQRIFGWLALVTTVLLAIQTAINQVTQDKAAAPSNTSLERTRER
jgi:predicted permease